MLEMIACTQFQILLCVFLFGGVTAFQYSHVLSRSIASTSGQFDPNLTNLFVRGLGSHRSSSKVSTGKPLKMTCVSQYTELKVPTLKGIFLSDITKQVQDAVDAAGVVEGQVCVLSRHTTTAITINEMEGRLVDDVRQYLLKLAPPDYPYLHNDLHLRNGPPDWPGGDEAWREQEPINAHSHLLNMLLGSSESVPVHRGKLMIGTWQSIIMVELDGPRERSVAVQVTGMTQ